MRLAIPTLILAVVLVLGWRVCSGGESDHLQLAERDLPAELRDGYAAATEGEALETATDGASAVAGRASAAVSAGSEAIVEGGTQAARQGASAVAEATEKMAQHAQSQVAAAQRAVVPRRPTVPGTLSPREAAPEDTAPDISAPTLPAVSATKPARVPEPVAAAAPAETPPAASPSAGRVYVVKPGDWLRQIAREQYGDAKRAVDIAQANGLSNPNALKPGQKLVLPR